MTLSDNDVRRLLAPFGLELSAIQTGRLLTYLDLLLRWNRRVNLTSIRTPEECVTRHFGESLFLARWVELSGWLLDIGSGAGFPGLALKIAFPQLAVTLLEPVAKKRAFLKEVARACGMEDVEARPERLEEFQSPLAPSNKTGVGSLFDAATARAVGNLPGLIRLAAACLKSDGRVYLWLSHDQGEKLAQLQLGLPQPLMRWGAPVAVPLSRRREIWIGTR